MPTASFLFAVLSLNPFLDSEAGEGICCRSVCTVLPGISDSISGVSQLDVREAIGVMAHFSEPVAILIHCIGDSGA